jgi:hypothetical protein
LFFLWVVEWWVEGGRTEREICVQVFEILAKRKDLLKEIKV